MVQRAARQSSSTVHNPHQQAKQLGVSIQPLQKLLKWLKDIESRMPQKKKSKANKSAGTRSLRSPSLKVEDKTRYDVMPFF